MANQLPEKIKHKGHIYVRADLQEEPQLKTADLGTALQSDVILINQVMEALKAGGLDKDSALGKLTEMRDAAKGILEELGKVL